MTKEKNFDAAKWVKENVVKEDNIQLPGNINDLIAINVAINKILNDKNFKGEKDPYKNLAEQFNSAIKPPSKNDKKKVEVDKEEEIELIDGIGATPETTPEKYNNHLESEKLRKLVAEQEKKEKEKKKKQNNKENFITKTFGIEMDSLFFPTVRGMFYFWLVVLIAVAIMAPAALAGVFALAVNVSLGAILGAGCNDLARRIFGNETLQKFATQGINLGLDLIKSLKKGLEMVGKKVAVTLGIIPKELTKEEVEQLQFDEIEKSASKQKQEGISKTAEGLDLTPPKEKETEVEKNKEDIVTNSISIQAFDLAGRKKFTQKVEKNPKPKSKTLIEHAEEKGNNTKTK